MFDSRIYCGNNLDVLKNLSSASVQCVVSSPPYWGLRDYGTAKWEGGKVVCKHEGVDVRTGGPGSKKQASNKGANAVAAVACRHCGARRIDQQLGLERTPELFIQHLVDVFREVHRVLKNDGVIWVNLGDSYANAAKETGRNDEKRNAEGKRYGATGVYSGRTRDERKGKRIVSCKSKDLVGIPWMFAFAMRADGWYLRQDIIWAKNSPMPESVTDRCTKSHEYIFLLSKRPKYYFDAVAIAEPAISGADPGLLRSRAIDTTGKVASAVTKTIKDRLTAGVDSRTAGDGSRNKRSVWTINSESFPGSHFAVFPTALVEPCILAGSKIGDLVLDPFAGSGTVGVVCKATGRNFVGIDLNPKYIKMAEQRIQRAPAMQTNLFGQKTTLIQRGKRRLLL